MLVVKTSAMKKSPNDFDVKHMLRRHHFSTSKNIPFDRVSLVQAGCLFYAPIAAECHGSMPFQRKYPCTKKYGAQFCKIERARTAKKIRPKDIRTRARSRHFPGNFRDNFRRYPLSADLAKPVTRTPAKC
jgi:hypothetical protein